MSGKVAGFHHSASARSTSCE
jgi:hypothetical protein